jgi:PKD repeat protein
MKLRKAVLCTPIAMLLWVACQKDVSFADDITTAKLVANTTQVKAGEAVKMSLKNARQGSVARWAVTPANGVTLDSVYSREGNEIAFTQPGTYTVNVEVRNVTVNCIPTPGWDTCYKSSPVTDALSTTVTVKN